jgi:hypothetical protein
VIASEEGRKEGSKGGREGGRERHILLLVEKQDMSKARGRKAEMRKREGGRA